MTKKTTGNDPQMPTPNHPADPANLPRTPFYSSISCNHNFFKFRIIISHLGITHLSFSEESHRQALERIKLFMPKALNVCPAEEIARVEEIIRRILAAPPYPDFKDNPFLRSGTTFQQRVWRIISQLKPGETTTYGELAAAAGSPRGARAAGHACNRNPLALIIPCHRVVAANGPGGFAGDLAIKLQLLEIEKKAGEQQTGPRLRDIKCSARNL